MQIDYLASHPTFIPVLANWHHQQWGHQRPGDTVEAYIARLGRNCGQQEIPTTVIAFSGAELLGSAMLIAYDMTNTALTPWLAGVYVAPEHRGRGVAAKLVRRVINEARALDVQRLYLYTPNAEPYYTRLGWTVVERTSTQGEDVTVMSYDCIA